MKYWIWLCLGVASLAGGAARAQSADPQLLEERIVAQANDESAAVADPRCVTLCVALLQAIGDEVKEQIYLTCDQRTGACEGKGHLSLGEERVPVAVKSALQDDTVNLRIDGPKGSFGTAEGEQLAMELAPDLPWQVGQFVVQRQGGGAWTADERPVVITVFVEKLVDAQP
jgi:hypothetical protein